MVKIEIPYKIKAQVIEYQNKIANEQKDFLLKCINVQPEDTRFYSQVRAGYIGKVVRMNGQNPVYNKVTSKESLVTLVKDSGLFIQEECQDGTACYTTEIPKGYICRVGAIEEAYLPKNRQINFSPKSKNGEVYSAADNVEPYWSHAPNVRTHYPQVSFNGLSNRQSDRFTEEYQRYSIFISKEGKFIGWSHGKPLTKGMVLLVTKNQPKKTNSFLGSRLK